MAHNGGHRGYRTKQTHELAQKRLQCSKNGPRIADATWVFVEAKLAETWNREQIAGFRKTNAQPTVSHESINSRIYADKAAGGTLLSPCVDRNPAGTLLRVNKSAEAPSRTKFPSTNVLPSSINVSILVTGKAIWSSAPVSIKRNEYSR